MHKDDDLFLHSAPAVLTLTAMVVFVVIPRFLLSPLLLRIADTFDIGYGQAAGLFMTASFGFIAGLLTSAFVARALTHRWTIVFSIASSGVSLVLLTVMPSITFFHLLLFAGSWATGLYPGSGVSSVAELVSERHRGKALALHESGPNLAFILAPVLSALIAPMFGWQGVFLLVGTVAILCAVAFGRFGKASGEEAQIPNFAAIGTILRNRSFWVILLLLGVAAVGAIGIYSVLPTYLITEHAYSERFVNNFIGASRVVGFVALFAAGMFADRYGFSIVVAVVIVVTGLLTAAIGLTTGTALLVAVFLQPMLVQSMFPVAINGLTMVVAPEARSLAVSLAIPFANLVGTGLAPLAIGAAGEAGRFDMSFVVVGAITVGSIGLLPLLKGGPLAVRAAAPVEGTPA